MVQTSRQVIRTACPRNCCDQCSILATVENGRIVSVDGDNTAITQGILCPKAKAFVPWVYHESRLKYPLRRVGERGEGKWEKMSWTEALDLVAEKLLGLKDKYGSDSILYLWGTGGHLALHYGIVPFRFFNLMGGATNMRGSLCANAGHTAVAYTYGESLGHDPEDMVNTKYLLVWGKNHSTTNIHALSFICEAVEKNSAKLVTIDPRLTEIGGKSDWYLQPRPGTDGALALGLMHVIIERRLYDEEFVSNYTVGFEQLSELVKKYTPEYVEQITTILRDDIVRLAVEYATTKPARIEVGMGLQRHTTGGQTFRAIASLAAICGNLGISGGGLGFPTSRFTYPRSHNLALKLDEKNINKTTIPYPKMAECMLSGKPKPIKGLFIWAGNPVNQNPDTNNVIKALKSKDLEFSVVIDPFMTDTVNLMDVVLPGCTFLEQDDVGVSYWHYYIQIMQQVVPPLEGAKTDIEILRELANRMGFGEYFRDDAKEFVRQAINHKPGYSIVEHVTVEKLREGAMHINAPKIVWADRKFPTPSGKVELYCERLMKVGCNPLPDFEEPKESVVRTPELAAKYPLSLISKHSRFSMSSMDYKNPILRKINPRPVVDINPADAAARGIQDGDMVLVENGRGKLTIHARVEHRIKRGAVAIPFGWNLADGTVNVLTADYLSDMGDNACYYTCLVEVTKLAQEADA